MFQIVDSRTFAEVDSNFMYANKYNYCENKVAFKMILSENIVLPKHYSWYFVACEENKGTYVISS